MKRIILLPVLIFALFIMANQAQASVAADFTVHEVAAYEIMPATFDQLVLDVTIPNKKTSGNDELKAITLRNLGSARDQSEIDAVKVWADSGAVGFQGLERDTLLGTATWDSLRSCWYLSGLSQIVPEAGLRIFTSIEIDRTIDNNRSVQFSIPMLSDSDADGEYDTEDLGLFMASKNNGPEDEMIANSGLMTVRSTTRDNQGPKAIITDPADKATITAASQVIKIKSRDQGKYGVASMRVKINDDFFNAEIVEVGTEYNTWQYQWNNLTSGSYALQALGSDSLGNETSEPETIAVIVKLPEPEPTPDPTPVPEVISVSSAYSTFGVNLYSQKADGSSAVRATIYVKDANAQALNGLQVDLAASRGFKDIITTSSNLSDSKGKVQFDIKSNTVGSLILSASAQGVGIGTPQEIVFVNPLAYPTKDLIKQTDQPAVYLVEKGKLRAFPSAEVFLSYGYKWADIEKIGDLSDFPRGDNVKYPDGYLVKGSGDKVYLISGGKKRWISTAAVFTGLGYQWGDIKVITDTLLDEYQTGESIETADRRPDGTLIKYADSDKVYVIKDGKKKWIENAEEFVNSGYKWEDIKVVEESEVYVDY